MLKTMKYKTLLFIGSLGIFFAAIGAFLFLEQQHCMNVPIISEEALEQYTEITSLDISLLSFNEEKVAFDLPSNTIYISQSSEKLMHYYNLQGKLTSVIPECTLYFLDNEELNNLSASIRNGVPLTLIMKHGTSFQRVNVLLTTLPVLYLDLENTYQDEYGTDIMTGDLTLWDSCNASTKSYSTTSSPVEWHMRGNSSKIYPKLSWKLSLRKTNGENNHLDLSGLGSDDDWILNPMSMDDTKIKEKLVQELWNKLASDTSYNYKMSSGEYIELVINGSYQGLYLLQRRVDAKYLNLNQNSDMLFKGRNTWDAASVVEGYEIISSPVSNEESYEKLNNALSVKNNSSININNFIDVTLLIQLISGADNIGYKNMFYAICQRNDIYELSFIPWDTDLSLGVVWGYDYEESLNQISERQELQSIRKQIPDIDQQISKRWKLLRNSTYSEENIFSIMNHLTNTLSSSGAIQRDQERWGLLHEENDNLNNLENFINERLLFLDEYYSQ